MEMPVFLCWFFHRPSGFNIPTNINTISLCYSTMLQFLKINLKLTGLGRAHERFSVYQKKRQSFALSNWFWRPAMVLCSPESSFFPPSLKVRELACVMGMRNKEVRKDSLLLQVFWSAFRVYPCLHLHT